MLELSTRCLFLNDSAPTELYTLSLPDALPSWWLRSGASVPAAEVLVSFWTINTNPISSSLLPPPLSFPLPQKYPTPPHHHKHLRFLRPLPTPTARGLNGVQPLRALSDALVPLDLPRPSRSTPGVTARSQQGHSKVTARSLCLVEQSFTPPLPLVLHQANPHELPGVMLPHADPLGFSAGTSDCNHG